MENGNRREAIVFVSHTVCESIVTRFEKLQRESPSNSDVFFAYNGTEATAEEFRYARQLDEDKLWTYEDSDILNVDYPNPWAKRRQKTLIPGNLDLLFIYFSRLESAYSRYWFIEYDVTYSGDWSEVFQAFESSNADLLGTTLTPYEQRPDWNWWPTFDPPSDCGKSEWVRGFFPISRLSTAALEILDEGYQAGWSGHREAVIPTLLRSRGLTLEDIGGDGPYVESGNENRFYTNTPKREQLSPGTFVYRPSRPSSGWRRGKLWHPVKPDAGRIASSYQLLKERIRARLPRY